MSSARQWFNIWPKVGRARRTPHLVSICLRTFHTRLSRFPTLEGDISQRWYTWSWGPISFLESPDLVLGFDLLLQAKLHVPGNLPAGKTTFHLPKEMQLLTYLLAKGTLQCQRNAFQQETYLNWFGLWGPKDLWKSSGRALKTTEKPWEAHAIEILASSPGV